MMLRTRLCFMSGLVLLLGARAVLADGDEAVSFSRDIRPLLADRCFACHGPDSATREADLRLDVADGVDGAHVAAIQPGSIDESELWHRINSHDDDSRMPPPDANKPPLTAQERRLFKAWIESGASYETFWAFRSPQKPQLPSVQESDWSDQPIDLFVLHRLESVGRQPASEAELRTLIRRLTLDLTGLPPTRDEIHKFLDATKSASRSTSSGSFAEVWEGAIDRLLATPQYGEHMARFWLDLVRYADTNGMHKDFYRNHIAYRDWVIRAFNDNLGYDDFVRFQVAGDLFDEPTQDQLVASGFHRLHLIIDRGTALPEESFAKNVIDRLSSVGTAFLGMTVHCAQCHDHKYDPITQKDFYSLYAFFNNIDAAPETQARPENGLQPPFVSLATPEQRQTLARYDRRITILAQEIGSAKNKLAKIKEQVAKRDNTDPPASCEQQEDAIQSQAKMVQRLERERKDLQQERNAFNRTVPYAMVMKERSEVRPTHIFVRGQYDAPGDVVERDTPGFLPPLNPSSDVATRMDLANWLADPAHPLTARVAVNRFWQQFFGVGFVKTSEDLGSQGDVPSHPQLFEYLVVSFVESGWDVKGLVKRIVMSKTYRQSSLATPEQFRQDPDNRLLARGSRFRLDAEVIRDQILFTSGLLSRRMYGASVKPPQPDGLWKAVTMTGQRFQADVGEAAYRRSLYTFWKRAMPPPQMTILNAPTRAACIARRERTNTPSQALLLLNETEYLKAARELAASTLRQKRNQRIDYMWEAVTGYLPDRHERESLRLLLRDLTAKYRHEPALTDALLDGAEDLPDVLSAKRIDLAAWTIVGNTLYNLDITKTRQ